MKTKLKITGISNGVTEVTEVAGVRMGEHLYIDGCDNGRTGDIIFVPEFQIEDFQGALAREYCGGEFVSE